MIVNTRQNIPDAYLTNIESRLDTILRQFRDDSGNLLTQGAIDAMTFQQKYQAWQDGLTDNLIIVAQRSARMGAISASESSAEDTVKTNVRTRNNTR